jgi:hypothetical protein
MDLGCGACRAALRVVLLALGLTVAGCAAFLREGSPGRPVRVTERTTVVILPEAPRVLPFVLRSEDLAAAVARIERMLGRGVQLQVDAALLPADRERFTHALASGIDNAVLALAQEQRVAPNTFAYAAPLVRVIACRYDTVSDYVRSDFDAETGTLSVRLPAPVPADDTSPERALFEPVVVHHALDGAYSAWLMARFAGVDPREVPESERDLYADFLRRTARTRALRGGRPVRGPVPGVTVVR